MLNCHIPRQYRASLHPPLTPSDAHDNPYKLTHLHRAARVRMGLTTHRIPRLLPSSPRTTFVFAFAYMYDGAHLYDALRHSYHIDLRYLDFDDMLRRSIAAINADFPARLHMIPMIESMLDQTFDYDLSLTTAMLHVLNHETYAHDNDDITIVCPTLVQHLYPDDISPD